MSSVPIEPELQSSQIDKLLERVRDGLRAEEELLDHYQSDSMLLAVLNTVLARKAERADVEVLEILGEQFAERRQEIREALHDWASPASCEAGIQQRVRREIGRLLKRKDRGPKADDNAMAEISDRGYQPATFGEPCSSIMFNMVDQNLESAIAKLDRNNIDQRRLHCVLARLHVLKKWKYKKLAALVFGPEQTDEELKLNPDKIRKWVQEAVRDINLKRKRNKGPKPAASNGPMEAEEGKASGLNGVVTADDGP